MRKHMEMEFVFCFAMLLVLVQVATLSAAQTTAAASATSPANAPAATAASAASVRIAPGDLLSIAVFDAPELAQDVRVDAGGTVQLSLIGSTKVEGLTAQEASQEIARALLQGKYLLHPQVNVLIKEFSSQGVSVLGEVQHPGVYQALGPRTLLDVIAMAGGMTNVADTTVSIKRHAAPQKAIKVSLRATDASKSIANDVQVYPGDLVMVPRAGIVYVLGEVNRPGGFVMQDNGSITLLQALAQAGGASPNAAANKAVLLRRTGDGLVTTKLELNKIARGRTEDVELRPNDIVFVPNSRVKSALNDFRNVAQSAGGASIYAIVH